MPRKLSVHDRVLLALAGAAEHTQKPIPYEEIVIESWKRFPERFSLRSHPEFPDSNDQNKSLYGPLKRNGYVVSLGDMVFRLTDAGVERSLALEEGLNGNLLAHSDARLSRDQERLLRNASSSEARAKWIGGRTDEIVDFDARAFFGITVRTPEEDRCRRVRTMQDAIACAVNAQLPWAPDLRELSDFLVRQFPVSVGS